ncbi:S-adenosyl-L-methionine-dependent methyltransferase [Xylaria longipes]|nr:S-adenosyl-L-methionine-dependent methyltransferase [Xylaria longipes]
MANFSKSSEDFVTAAQNVLASHDETARKQMLNTAMKVMAMLEAPLDTVWRTIMSPYAPAALMTLIKAGVIQEIAKSDSATSADQLASASGADKLLIVRLLRPLNALGFVKETKQEEYAPTPITKILFMFSAATRSLANLPFHLEKTHFKNVERAPGPFQDAHNTQDNMFLWLIKDPPMMGNFNAFVTGQRADRKQWFDFFDIDAILLNGANTDSDATLLIDIGGGEGDLISKIERQKYDFFQGQPVNGARCYYFCSIFHDWPDADCIRILKNKAMAMTPGYSKLLMSEFVLPASNTPLYPALLDVNMMAVLNGMERTEAQFSALLDAAGLKVVKFWSIAPEVEGLVEAVLKD